MVPKFILRPGLILSVLFFFMLILNTQAQVDTTAQNSLNLLDELNQDGDSVQLLPENFLFTQKIFWGKKGLMRNFDRFELTPEKRADELKLRRGMLKVHQTLGIITLFAMAGQAVVGSQLYNGKNIKGAHEGLAAATNIGYFTTAGLSLLAPPRMLAERKGSSSIKIHKILAAVHLSSMIAVNVLAGQTADNRQMQNWHRAAAITAFTSYAAAMAVIKF
jgi:hypothetical protein